MCTHLGGSAKGNMPRPPANAPHAAHAAMGVWDAGFTPGMRPMAFRIVYAAKGAADEA